MSKNFDSPIERDFCGFVCSEPNAPTVTTCGDGPTVQVGSVYSVSCSKCGISAFEVDAFMGGF